MQEVMVPLIKGRAMKANQRVKRAYDKMNKVANWDDELEVGEVVYIQVPKNRGKRKYTRPYTGPFVIDSIDRAKQAVRVMDPITGKVLSSDYSFDRLKRLNVKKDFLDNMDLDLGEDYEVSAIVEHKMFEGQLWYLMVFEGYPEPEWISSANADKCDRLIAEYWEAKGAPTRV
eukprot:Nk52_evm1s622 gene=Nk52_evmTU1s622